MNRFFFWKVNLCRFKAVDDTLVCWVLFDCCVRCRMITFVYIAHWKIATDTPCICQVPYSAWIAFLFAFSEASIASSLLFCVGARRTDRWLSRKESYEFFSILTKETAKALILAPKLRDSKLYGSPSLPFVVRSTVGKCINDALDCCCSLFSRLPRLTAVRQQFRWLTFANQPSRCIWTGNDGESTVGYPCLCRWWISICRTLQ